VTLSTIRRCLWCGAAFRASEGTGRPRAYCRRSHRQRAFESRRLAASHGLGADDVLMSRASLAELRDAIYQLEAAMEDVDTDLAEADDPGRHRSALWHLYGAAANLRGMRLEPRAVGPA
jgi:hypothetical protein